MVCRLKSTAEPRWHPFRRKTPKYFARLDGLNPSHVHMIYDSGLRNYLVIASSVTTISAIGCLTLFAVSVQRNDAVATPLELLGPFQLFESQYEPYAYVAFLVFLMASCAYIITHTPVRIYYCPAQRKFKLIFQRFIPWLRTTVDCPPGALTPLPGNRGSVVMQVMGNVAYRNGGRRLVLMEHRFKMYLYYNVLMGFDDAEIIDDQT